MPSSMPEAGPQDRHDQRLGGGQPHARGRRHRGRDVDRLGAHVAGRLVGEQGDELVGEPPEGRGVGALVAQRGELVGDQRVVGDMDPHGAT